MGLTYTCRRIAYVARFGLGQQVDLMVGGAETSLECAPISTCSDLPLRFPLISTSEASAIEPVSSPPYSHADPAMLAELLGSRTRAHLLRFFFGSAVPEMHMRGLKQATGMSAGTAQN